MTQCVASRTNVTHTARRGLGHVLPTENSPPCGVRENGDNLRYVVRGETHTMGKETSSSSWSVVAPTPHDYWLSFP